ncbi:MAG: phytoene desaturase, partial [Bacteroidales bacterium]|nr:phytoene desaturase [Bacteroidales bacterium]
MRTDPAAAPPGCDALTIVIGAGHYMKKYGKDWDELQRRAREAVIDKLVKAGLTDIEQHIMFEMPCTPMAWESITNVSRGAVFGSLGHNIFQMGW